MDRKALLTEKKKREKLIQLQLAKRRRLDRLEEDMERSLRNDLGYIISEIRETQMSRRAMMVFILSMRIRD